MICCPPTDPHLKTIEMAKPQVLIFSGYGLNCEQETQYAFERAGSTVKIVHINDLISGQTKLTNFQILAFPGGFSFGDDTGSGNGYANRVKNHLWSALQEYVNHDNLVIGVCNGFQILTRLGLVPALNGQTGQPEVAILDNEIARYQDRWVDLIVTNQSPWLQGISKLSLPIAHGEGRVQCSKAVHQQLIDQNQIALRYTSGEICNYQQLPANPNGSLDDIAALTDPTGRILGLMPHPERAISFTQLPNWPVLADQLKRQQKPLPKDAPALTIFKNAIRYFQ